MDGGVEVEVCMYVFMLHYVVRGWICIRWRGILDPWFVIVDSICGVSL